MCWSNTVTVVCCSIVATSYYWWISHQLNQVVNPGKDLLMFVGQIESYQNIYL